MPIYEYQCAACGHQLEALQKLSDAPLTECPSCAQAQLHKKVSATAFHLKGNGWYQTDFKEVDKKKTADNGKTKEESPGANAQETSATVKEGASKEAGAETKVATPETKTAETSA